LLYGLYFLACCKKDSYEAHHLSASKSYFTMFKSIVSWYYCHQVFAAALVTYFKTKEPFLLLFLMRKGLSQNQKIFMKITGFLIFALGNILQ